MTRYEGPTTSNPADVTITTDEAEDRVKIDLDPEDALRVLLRPRKPQSK